MKLTQEAKAILNGDPQLSICAHCKNSDCGMKTAKTAREISTAISWQHRYRQLSYNGTASTVMSFARVSRKAAWYRLLNYLKDHMEDAEFNRLTQAKQLAQAAEAFGIKKINAWSVVSPMINGHLVEHREDGRGMRITVLGLALLKELEPMAK